MEIRSEQDANETIKAALQTIADALEETAPVPLCVRMFAGSRPDGTDPDFVCGQPADYRLHSPESQALGRHEFMPPCESREKCTQPLYQVRPKATQATLLEQGDTK